MGVSKVEAYEYRCDACGKTEVRSDTNAEDLPSGWFKGEVENGVQGGPWLACKKTCVAKAVARVFEARPGRDD